MKKCLICGKEFEKLQSLSLHIRNFHLITLQEYYDHYLKTQQDDGLCEVCGSETRFTGLSGGYNRFCCAKCINNSKEVKDKIVNTWIKKYGVDNPNKSEDVQERRRQNCLKEHGVDHISKTERWKKNYKGAILAKYNTDCVFKDPGIQEKVKGTNRQKFGADHFMQSDYGVPKVRDTLIKKYNVDSPVKVPGAVEKMSRTFLKKYGVTWNTKSEEVQEVIRENCLARWGVTAPCKDPELADRLRKSNLQTFWPNQDETFRFNMVELLDHEYKNAGTIHRWKCLICGRTIENCWNRIQQSNDNTCPNCYPSQRRSSRPQRELFEVCQQVLPYPVLEYPNNGKFIDIAVPQLSLAIEYDDSYWHQDHWQDMKRQKLLEDNGWIFLRYRDYIPTSQELLDNTNSVLGAEPCQKR